MGLRPGERIDLFLSHSWHDNAEWKWRTLQGYVTNFIRVRNRWPTFWLDKVCIDQRSIRDGLRVLPVMVSSCERVLVLWGDTYPSRLWCIWELFTLLAFTEMEHIAQRLALAPVCEDVSIASICDKLEVFEVRKAHCYDPNEERRLRHAIDALGDDRFNRRVRTLGGNLRPRCMWLSNLWLPSLSDVA